MRIVEGVADYADVFEVDEGVLHFFVVQKVGDRVLPEKLERDNADDFRYAGLFAAAVAGDEPLELVDRDDLLVLLPAGRDELLRRQAEGVVEPLEVLRIFAHVLEDAVHENSYHVLGLLAVVLRGRSRRLRVPRSEELFRLQVISADRAYRARKRRPDPNF